jgi:hypothetical protein
MTSPPMPTYAEDELATLAGSTVERLRQIASVVVGQEDARHASRSLTLAPIRSTAPA